MCRVQAAPEGVRAAALLSSHHARKNGHSKAAHVRQKVCRVRQDGQTAAAIHVQYAAALTEQSVQPVSKRGQSCAPVGPVSTDDLHDHENQSKHQSKDEFSLNLRNACAVCSHCSTAAVSAPTCRVCQTHAFDVSSAFSWNLSASMHEGERGIAAARLTLCWEPSSRAAQPVVSVTAPRESKAPPSTGKRTQPHSLRYSCRRVPASSSGTVSAASLAILNTAAGLSGLTGVLSVAMGGAGAPLCIKVLQRDSHLSQLMCRAGTSKCPRPSHLGTSPRE